MTKKTRQPGSFLRSMIAKTRTDLPHDPTELSDANLIRSMARGLSDFVQNVAPDYSADDDFAAFACMFALGRAHASYHPNEGEAAALAVAENLLAEIDLEFDCEQLRATWRSDAFKEWRQQLGQFGAAGIADQPGEKIGVWCAALWECARAGLSASDEQASAVTS
jgi:hypothetical protein